MLINLKNCVTNAGTQEAKIELHERLPSHLSSPPTINCRYEVEARDHYYLLHLEVDTSLLINCQRCLHDFAHHYKNKITLALCDSDEVAESLMDQYECITWPNKEVDLQDLLSDELHLYTPEFHSEISLCNSEMSRFINIKT